ncbi:LysR family transcriptional regulator [Pararhodobacter oceanensis]|uniref:LysR family transcriptional regulator n=1 Tax=Pararhodobacter oceanensis TaxID=2172121 RepID=UPI003A92FF30
MDTRFILTLLAVVDAGSFAGAARRENLTPAAVAQRIRSLETALGKQLVVRSGQQVAPTQDCLSILPRLKKIALNVAQIASDFDDTGLAGPIRLGAISTALSDRVPSVLSRFAAQAPAATLSVTPGTSKDLYARLLDEELDAAFLVRPPFKTPKSITCIHIESQPMVMVTQAGDSRSPEAIIRQEKALVYDPTSWGGQLVTDWIKAHIPHSKILCELDAVEAIAIAVGHGIGYSIIPAWAGLDDLVSVKRIALPQIAQSRELVLAHRRLTTESIRLLRS